MTDYALTDLGPNRFEEMSQALALKALGPYVEIFGDGPDGGREASFQSLSHFPTPDAPWTGYGVLQAKFRKRPEGTAKDAEWLIDHINSELRAWADPHSNRVRKGRLPEYLLITSNVVLSSVPGSGGIDRVQKALQERVQELQLPLNGWEIWHYDKICRLLDNNEDVRHAYADAVLSGDVLARLHKHVQQMEASHSLPGIQALPGLPRELRPLFGREAEIDEGRRLLERPDGDSRSTVVVTGPPGIGKSAIALRLSRLVADVYPDGQFHIDLALAAGEGDPVDLVLALLRTMRPGEPLPEGRAQQLAALRATLSGSKVLLLIDDVVSEEALLEVLQVDGPFGLVCTSRARLSGLTALVHLIELGPLPDRHSEELVRAVAGPTRLSDGQVCLLAEACAGHPLALHVAAAHLARRPRVSVDRFLDDITSPDRGLRALRAGQIALEPVLERSYGALSPEQADLLTTLGILPHMSVTPDVVAAAISPQAELDDAQVDAATQLLDSLFELSLIEQIDEDRFVFHDILHRFARLKAASATAEHREAVIRQTCFVLGLRVQTATESIGFVDKEAKVPAQGNAGSLRMLNADRPGAVALTELAGQYQMWGPLVVLASDLTASLWHGSHWKDLGRVYQCVLEAGTQSGKPEWTASALYNLGMVAGHLGDTQRAADLYQRSAETAHEAENLYQMHMAQLALGSLLINLGRAREAIPFLRNGLPFWRIIEDNRMLAHALGHLGQAHLAIGQLRRADQYLYNSRDLSRTDSHAELWNHGALAALLRRTGRLTEAAQDASLDIERARAVGSREWEAKALMELAETPLEERPASAPVQPLEAALAIYRDTGDVQGQVRALFQLGTQAAERADIHQAADHLGECADLAAGIGDYEHAARALAYVASYHGGIGHLDEAETYFADARDMANHLGNPIVIAQTLQKYAEYLWHRGRIGETVAYLTEAVQLLEETDEKRGFAQAKAALGEALVVAGRWQEGAQALESVVSVVSDEASPATRAQASRALAVLYSRRGLYREAMSTITKALDQCERADDKSAVLHCRLALGNVQARNDRWSEALDQYDKATELATEQKDLHVLLTARGMAAVCRLHSEDKEQAVAEIVKLIPVTEQLGMQSLEAALHLNVGSHHALSRDHEKAVTEFHKALALIEQLEDATLRAPCLLSLTRSYRALGDTEQARAHAREAFDLHQELGSWSDAGEALVLLRGLYLDSTQDDSREPTIEELLSTERKVDNRVLEAIRARLRTISDGTVIKADREVSHATATIAERRKINISDTVRQALSGLDVEQLTAHLGNSRQACAACNLSIDETGEAELLLVDHPGMDRLMLRLAHPHCVASKVVQLKGKAPKEPKVVFEVECILFGGDRAGIIADCYGGWGSYGDGQVQDLVLTNYRKAGFTNLQSLLQTEDNKPLDLRDIPGVNGSGVQAQLEDNNLSIVGPDGQLLHRMPLNFFPRWYQRAAEKSLIVVVGRNLQGMAADDLSYLVRAMASGNAVGGTVPLTVVRPSRNGPCPCMMRTGRKFKHCCGRGAISK
ncbi:tetratricopeptide repeat protein [Streptomyces sp. MMS24-I29]|uniref:tetratricopeptide repeat protein n=1 Tax=Streptomyces sp. MMS24-I29 TaxID=3351480 RepID=UPI003C7E0FB4